MSSRSRKDGWATPKRCLSAENNHFVNFEPLDTTIVIDEKAISSHQIQSSSCYDGNCVSSNGGLIYKTPVRSGQDSVQMYTPMIGSQDFVTAKDEIIEQNNVIISKQKSIISQLRQTNIELDELLIQKQHELQCSKNGQMKLREYQHDIFLLKQQLTEERKAKSSTTEKFQRQLGKTEYEYGKLEIAMKEIEISKSAEYEKLNRELKKAEMDLKVEQQKNGKINSEIKAVKLQNRKLQTYLEELATAEELKDLQTELKNLKNDKEVQFVNYQQLEKEMRNTKTKYQEKEMECNKLNQLNIEQRDELSKLITKFKKYCSWEKGGGMSIEAQESINLENSKLHKENEHLKKSLQKHQSKIYGLYKEKEVQRKQYEGQESKCADLLQSLNEKVEEKTIALTKLNANNQGILSDSLQYQNELKNYKERYSDEFQRSLHSLAREMLLCVDDVKSFLSLCISRIKGNEPSLNTLLGLRDSSPDLTLLDDIPNLDVEYMKLQLKDIGDLRNDVDELRHLVSEHYAQEIGDNMCQTQ